jgi:hypothetical protein
MEKAQPPREGKPGGNLAGPGLGRDDAVAGGMTMAEPRRNTMGEPIDDAANARTLGLVKVYEAAHAGYFGRRWAKDQEAEAKVACEAYERASGELNRDLYFNGPAELGGSVYRYDPCGRVAVSRHLRRLEGAAASELYAMLVDLLEAIENMDELAREYDEPFFSPSLIAKAKGVLAKARTSGREPSDA